MHIIDAPNQGRVAHKCDIPAFSRSRPEYQAALERCVDKLRTCMPIIGLRNPKIGREDHTWTYCGPFDWVNGFYAGQLWLAYQLTGDDAFANSARARRRVFRDITRTRAAQEHDLGFQFSLSCVAEWLMTGDVEARDLAIAGASALASRFTAAGNYVQAWNAFSPAEPERSSFVAGRIIADSMMNMALLNWAFRETGRTDFLEIAESHSDTVFRHIIRPDDTSFHCFIFDPVDGRPLQGETHQGHADDSCWSRGQAWLIHGFAQSYVYTRNELWLDASRRLAATTEEFMRGRELMPWDFRLSPGVDEHVDSSAAAVTASGLYLLAKECEADEAERWRRFADRLLDGLLRHCDLTSNPAAHGMLDLGASHIPNGRVRNMLPYGDYFFMEALMRSLGHDSFFW